MSMILLKGGRVVDPANGVDGVQDVLIEGGTVKRVGPKLAVPEKNVICTVGDGAYIFGAPTAAQVGIFPFLKATNSRPTSAIHSAPPKSARNASVIAFPAASLRPAS